MTRRPRIARLASEELAEAVRWYEGRRRGLGREFYDAVTASLDSITTHPEIGAAAFGVPDIRRVIVARFPYQIVYRLSSDAVVVLAFAHLKRRPGFWKRRS